MKEALEALLNDVSAYNAERDPINIHSEPQQEVERLLTKLETIVETFVDAVSASKPFSSEQVVTKANKLTGEREQVTVQEFLEFVGSGAKGREKALISLMEGGLDQNLEVAYFLAPMRQAMRKGGEFQ